MYGLGQLISLSNGVPSHDIFTRVFAGLDSEHLTIWLNLWLETVVGADGKHIALAGKFGFALRSSNNLTAIKLTVSKA